MISVETTEGSVRVTIPKEDVPPERLISFLDWLRMEAVVRRSTLTEAEADTLAEEAKKSWWTANKDRLLRPDER